MVNNSTILVSESLTRLFNSASVMFQHRSICVFDMMPSRTLSKPFFCVSDFFRVFHSILLFSLFLHVFWNSQDHFQDSSAIVAQFGAMVGKVDVT